MFSIMSGGLPDWNQVDSSDFTDRKESGFIDKDHVTFSFR